MSRVDKDKDKEKVGFSIPIHMAPLVPNNGPETPGSVSPIEKDKEKKGEDGYGKPQRQSSLPSVSVTPTKEQAGTPRAHTSRESRESREKKDKRDKKDKKKSSRDPGHTPREKKSLLKSTSATEVKDKDSLIRALVLRINELEQSEKDLLQRLTEYEQKQLVADKEREKEKTTAPRDTSASRLGGLVSIFRSNKKTINLSDITIGEKLGAGGSNAVIFSCYIDGWQCAMKELDLEYMNNEGISAFEGEIRLLELLPQHPNIVRYLFHENKNKKLRLFMTRYSTTLHHEISTHKPQRFPAKECMKYALDIVRGLEFLHSHHIIHRDLKSENIFAMLNDRREITRLAIGDFDTAKKVSAKNQAKTVLGTPQWMAPEVLSANDHGGSSVDDGSGEEHSYYSFPADIYSFGMVLYELLAMKPPYDGCKPMQVSMNILLHRLPPPPTDLEPEFQPLLSLHLECTKANPSERPSLSTIKEKLLLSGS